MNEELSLLTVAAVNYVSPQKENLFSRFRAALGIDEIEDPNAKELFIALEECLRHEETGMDELLARIPSPNLRNYLIERGASGEFSINQEQLMADGIKKIRAKGLERQNEEIIIKLRGLRKAEDRSSEVNELLAEKMRIDNELHSLKQGR
jgi:DNA primase